MGSDDFNSIELEVLESKFDAFLTKTIIGASKAYYNKETLHNYREVTIIDDDNIDDYSQNFIDKELGVFDVYNECGPFEQNYKLNMAYESLSLCEKTVIFLYYKQKYRTGEIASIMKMKSQSVSRIKKKALLKLKAFMEGANDNE